MSLDRLVSLARLAEECATSLEAPVERYLALAHTTLQRGGTIFFAGNGGSAAHAQHMATEYVVRYQPVARRAARAISLTTDTSLLTAAANDLGFEQVFARQIEALGGPGDLLVVVSTSGRSANLVRAVEMAKTREMSSVGLLGRDGGALRDLVDVAIVVPTGDAALAQEIQLAIDHHVCSMIEPTL
jgi:D-sedoheptulose 7-phosphate isomerase